MKSSFVDLDVRPILRNGGEPFQQIMDTIAALTPGQGLRLFATFKPTPLLQMLGSKGFNHKAKELEGGEWEVLFIPGDVPVKATPTPSVTQNDPSDRWPDPVQSFDHRDLDPPEPMERILAAVETMKDGDVLSALLCREPIFLLPELAKRGHRWRGGFEPDGETYRILVRAGEVRH